MTTVKPNQAGLNSYVDPNEPSMGGSVAGVNANMQKALDQMNLQLHTSSVTSPD
jgi:hypothetical protein